MRASGQCPIRIENPIGFFFHTFLSRAVPTKGWFFFIRFGVPSPLALSLPPGHQWSRKSFRPLSPLHRQLFDSPGAINQKGWNPSGDRSIFSDSVGWDLDVIYTIKRRREGHWRGTLTYPPFYCSFEHINESRKARYIPSNGLYAPWKIEGTKKTTLLYTLTQKIGTKIPHTLTRTQSSFFSLGFHLAGGKKRRFL